MEPSTAATRTARALGLLGLCAALLLPLPPGAAAVHAVDHRYVVLGYVRDARGLPVAGLLVRVVRTKTGLAYDTATDANGFYVVVVHLHDEDVLDGLRVAAGPAFIRLEARFNPLDPSTPRGTRVDFTSTRAVERPDAFAETFAGWVRGPAIRSP